MAPWPPGHLAINTRLGVDIRAFRGCSVNRDPGGEKPGASWAGFPVPEGHPTIAQRFNAGEQAFRCCPRPEGALEIRVSLSQLLFDEKYLGD